MIFELPPTGTKQPPAFTTAAACQDWLATVPLANAVQAQSMLLRQFGLLRRYTLPHGERFAILEALRAPLADVQDDAAKKFDGNPLPLAPHEQAALETSLSLWFELALGYLRCFDEACDGVSTAYDELEKQRELCASDPKRAAQAALMAERTVAVFADWQLDLCRAGELPDAAYWQKGDRRGGRFNGYVHRPAGNGPACQSLRRHVPRHRQDSPEVALGGLPRRRVAVDRAPDHRTRSSRTSKGKQVGTLGGGSTIWNGRHTVPH